MDSARDLVAALAGAFAEGVDLGPRGAQIRAIGKELEAMVDSLRPQLAGLNEQDRIGFYHLDLDLLAVIARDACAYGAR